MVLYCTAPRDSPVQDEIGLPIDDEACAPPQLAGLGPPSADESTRLPPPPPLPSASWFAATRAALRAPGAGPRAIAAPTGANDGGGRPASSRHADEDASDGAPPPPAAAVPFGDVGHYAAFKAPASGPAPAAQLSPQIFSRVMRKQLGSRAPAKRLEAAYTDVERRERSYVTVAAAASAASAAAAPAGGAGSVDEEDDEFEDARAVTPPPPPPPRGAVCPPRLSCMAIEANNGAPPRAGGTAGCGFYRGDPGSVERRKS